MESARDWDRAAGRALGHRYLDPAMAAAKRRDHLELLERWLPGLEAATLLKTDLWEEGVAGDELLFTLARRVGEARGIDLSDRVVAAAQAAADTAGASNVELRATDLRHLPFPDESFDAIVSTSTLDHLAEPADLDLALGELRRVLKHDGTLVASVDNSDNIGDPLLRAAGAVRRVPFPLGASLSLDDLRAALRRSGFEPREHAYLAHGPRLLTTVGIRGARLLPPQTADRAATRLLGAFEAVGRRLPRQLGAFVAVRATKP
jgi:SAM-dependent methyltransferase